MLETCLIHLSFLQNCFGFTKTRLQWLFWTSCFTLMCHHMCWAQETWGGHSEESWQNKDWACFHSCRTLPAEKHTERKAGECFLCCRDRRIENSRQSPSFSGCMLSMLGQRGRRSTFPTDMAWTVTTSANTIRWLSNSYNLNRVCTSPP